MPKNPRKEKSPTTSKKVKTEKLKTQPKASSSSPVNSENDPIVIHDDDVELSLTTHENVLTAEAKYELIRTPLSNGDGTSDDLQLEMIEQHHLQSTFDATKYLPKEKGHVMKIYCIDLGSSFTKGNKLQIEQGKRVRASILKFGHREKTQFLPTRTFYNSITGEIQMGELKDEKWEELENLKKIFMVSELLEIGLSSKKKLRVSNVIYSMIKDLIIQLLTTKKEDQAYLEGVGAWIFTCPTGTSEYTKLIFRNCIYHAYTNLKINSDHPITIDDIYIMEEYALLQYFANNQQRLSTMFVDLGHLTLDVVVMELIHGEYMVTFKNGETCGMSIIHQLLKSKGMDANAIMKDLFENYYDSNELPPSLKAIEEEINEKLKLITKPLCMMILQKQADCIHFSGAITRVAYFQKKLREYVSQERLQQIKKELTPYLKDEFLNKPIPECKFLCETTGESALLSGAEEMINSSLESRLPIPIIFKEANELNSLPVSYLEQFVPAMIYEESKGKKIEKKIALREFLFDMYIKQDTEIFLIKFSPLIDTKKISSINFNNFTQVGIIEFLRFTNLIVCFDNKQITPSKLEFFIKLELEEEHLIVKIYYTKKTIFKKSEIRIEKKGRTERISINDSAELIFKTKEDESRTWYGVYYDTLSIISGFSSVSIPKELVKQEVGNVIAKRLKPTQEVLSIPSTHPKDKEFVKKHLAKCAVCRETIDYKTRVNISYQTLPQFRLFFDDSSISIGFSCHKCYGIYREHLKNQK